MKESKIKSMGLLEQIRLEQELGDNKWKKNYIKLIYYLLDI